MTDNPRSGLRADAQRNRDQILAAAREIFAVHGPDVPMEEIARTAGVGVGTLYRRFPDREALVRAVAQQSFTQVLADARAAAAEEQSAWDSLERLVRQSHQLRVSFQLAWSAAWAMDALHADSRTVELKNALVAEIAEMVGGAQAEGSMRPDVGAGDVAVLFVLNLRQPSARDNREAVGLDRAAAIMLDGLRAHSDSELPGRPITADDVRQWSEIKSAVLRNGGAH